VTLRRDILRSSTTRPSFFAGNQGLEIIRIKPLNDLHTMLLEPGTTFLARKFEHGIVVLLPKPESVIVDFVDTLP